MPETVSGYEFFQIPCSRESDAVISHATYRNELGVAGHRSRVLYGPRTGRWRFHISHDSLSGTPTPVITFDGVSMSRAAYIRDFFRRHTVSGEPFVITAIENNQYYLVEFAESEQTLHRKLTAMYATQIDLVQVRVPGVTVFDPARMAGLWGYFDAEISFDGQGLADNTPMNDTAWPDLSGNGHHLDFIGLGSKYQTNEQNGLPIIELSPSTATTYLSTSLDPVIYEALLVMKMREAAFSNFAGVLTADADVAMLVGDSGETTFYDHAFDPETAPFFYEKNSVEYQQSNQQAPMEQFGLVRVRMSEGLGMTNMRIGRDRAATDRYAEMDLAAMVFFDTLQPHSDIWELAEHLETRWDI